MKLLCRFPSILSRIQLHRNAPDISQLAFLSLVEKGQTVFDIGANFGSYTRLFSGIVGENAGRVFAFEPVTDSMKRLRLAVEGLNNVTLVQQGLSSVPNKAPVFIPNGDLGQSSLVRHDSGSWSSDTSCREETVDLTTLDIFIASNEIHALDFVKIDVEGAEPHVLSGGEAAITRFKPIIYIELNSNWLKDFGESPLTVSAKLARWGFTFTYVPVIVGRHFGFRHASPTASDNRDFVFSVRPLKSKLLIG